VPRLHLQLQQAEATAAGGHWRNSGAWPPNSTEIRHTPTSSPTLLRSVDRIRAATDPAARPAASVKLLRRMLVRATRSASPRATNPGRVGSQSHLTPVPERCPRRCRIAWHWATCGGIGT
jgi:hypothetical protein